MARRNAVVDRVSSVADWPAEPRAAKGARGRATKDVLAIRFGGGKSGLLDLSAPRSHVWADVLKSLRAMNQPAYVEIDPSTRYITELLCPIEVTVGSLTPAESGDIYVELVISHARHILRADNPEFQALLRTLEAARKSGATLWVTETLDDHEIIDARPAPAPPGRRRR